MSTTARPNTGVAHRALETMPRLPRFRGAERIGASADGIITGLFQGGICMKVIASQQAPRAIGPYSQAIEAGDHVFTAGQIALDPASMELVPGGIAEQTDRVLQNLAAVLESAGTSLGQVAKTTVFLVDMGDFPAMNQVYERHFGSHKPARSTVGVGQLPKNARVLIEAIALKR